MTGRAVTPGYDGPEGTEWGDDYRPGKAEWVETGQTPAVADDNGPCPTCGKTHKPGDHEHSEVL